MLTRKLPHVGTTIFTTMSAMAADFGAINLSQGFPDFSPPNGLMDALKHAIQSDTHQYPPMTGIANLRQAISHKIADMYDADVNPDTEVTVTSGATEAVFVAIQCLVTKGDEVIVLDPAYDAYVPAIELAGGKPVHINLSANFRVDWSLVESAITNKTRAIVINSPHNPCGSVLLEGDLRKLSELVQLHGLFVVSDEVYEHMVYDGELHHSVLRYPELRDRSIAISSFGKTYHATGWKVGYAVASPELSAEFRKIHQYVTFTTHSPSQFALAEFMDACPEHHQDLPGFYQRKRDLFASLLAESEFKLLPSAGTYFQLADYSAINDKMSDVEFCEYLTQTVGVAAIPLSVFYAQPPEQKLIRFCFAKDDATLKLAADKLCQLKTV